jgi:hypothetical protein
MFKYGLLLVMAASIFSCSRKHTPDKTVVTTTVPTDPSAITNPDSVVVKKRNFTPRKKDIIPDKISVNDKAAHRAIDGRLYYDLLGHRYWKNYKDGKYYLFSQKMYDNPAFKPPK